VAQLAQHREIVVRDALTENTSATADFVVPSSLEARP
jgi:hypothetical protein